MQGIITVSQEIITGAFVITFSFVREIGFMMDDVRITTLEGDALGHTKDSFGGDGVGNYFILCYLPEGRAGKSRIAVVKDGLTVEPVVVAYDTLRTVRATWGPPVRRGRNIEIPVAFVPPIQNLKKRHVALTPPAPFQIYRTEVGYHLLVPEQVSRVGVAGTVLKENGVSAEIVESVASCQSSVNIDRIGKPGS